MGLKILPSVVLFSEQLLRSTVKKGGYYYFLEEAQTLKFKDSVLRYKYPFLCIDFHLSYEKAMGLIATQKAEKYSLDQQYVLRSIKENLT